MSNSVENAINIISDVLNSASELVSKLTSTDSLISGSTPSVSDGGSLSSGEATKKSLIVPKTSEKGSNFKNAAKASTKWKMPNFSKKSHFKKII